MARSRSVTARRAPEPGRSALAVVAGSGEGQEIDPLVHERARLAILSALAVSSSLSFNELKRMTKTTDGNLSVHAHKLEEAGLVACQKGYLGRVPHTEFRITSKGRRALERYLSHMEALIRAVRGDER